MDRLANVAKQNIYFIPKGIDYHSNIKFVPCISGLSARGNYGGELLYIDEALWWPNCDPEYVHTRRPSLFISFLKTSLKMVIKKRRLHTQSNDNFYDRFKIHFKGNGILIQFYLCNSERSWGCLHFQVNWVKHNW